MIHRLHVIIYFIILLFSHGAAGQPGNPGVKVDSAQLIVVSDAACRIGLNQSFHTVVAGVPLVIPMAKGKYVLTFHDGHAGIIGSLDVKLKKNEKKKLEVTLADTINAVICATLNSFSENLVQVKGGTFQMGCRQLNDSICDDDEFPAHNVRISSFYMSKYEVTQKQWRAVMGANPSAYSGCDDCPVERVTWDDVQNFLIKLNAATGKAFRLPTEAEWEFAASGGIESMGFRYSGSNNLAEVAWCAENSDRKTHTVGRRKANEIGLYDMSGNVWEWCSDIYDPEYYKQSPAADPKGPVSGEYHIMRGGSWEFDPWDARISNRGRFFLNRPESIIGLRLAMD